MVWPFHKRRVNTEVFSGEGFFVECPGCGGYHRDTNPAFCDLIEKACDAVQASTLPIYQDFGIGDPDGRWDYDSATQLMTFTTSCGRRSRARYFSVGTWIEETGSFMWSWASDNGPPTRQAAEFARQFGTENKMEVLTSPMLLVGRSDVWHLCKLTAWLSQLPMIYSVPTSASCRAFMALEHPAWDP